jgi:hypothetical protein
MLGFGGHFSTKSRRYSTTLGALRRGRVAYAILEARAWMPAAIVYFARYPRWLSDASSEVPLSRPVDSG